MGKVTEQATGHDQLTRPVLRFLLEAVSLHLLSSRELRQQKSRATSRPLGGGLTSLNWPSRARYSRRVLQIVGLKWPAQPAISTACRIIPFQRASRQIFTCSTQSAVGLFLLLLFRTVQLAATSDLSASIPATILGL